MICKHYVMLMLTIIPDNQLNYVDVGGLNFEIYRMKSRIFDLQYSIMCHYNTGYSLMIYLI